MTINDTIEKFKENIRRCNNNLHSFFSMPKIEDEKIITVGISGGPDSFALLKLLSEWSIDKTIKIIAITIDHKLRPESKQESLYVKNTISDWTNVEHKTIEWNDEKPKNSIQEEARNARYRLLQDYMKKINSQYLFIAHHMDDQAETILFRLCKGSGLKGLSGIKPVQKRGDIYIIRPLLDLVKNELVNFCDDYKIEYINDPTNENEKYSRPRLRSAKDILEQEGLTSKRLAKLASRVNQAEQALEFYADKLYKEINNLNKIKLDKIKAHPFEIRVRTILKIINQTGSNVSDYGVRLHRLESILDEVFNSNKNITRTIGGCIIKTNIKNNSLTIEPEK